MYKNSLERLFVVVWLYPDRATKRYFIKALNNV